SILYLTEEIVKYYRKAAESFGRMSQFHDIGFAQLQPYFNVLTFEMPMFYQTSSKGTSEALTSYKRTELRKPDRKYWLPETFMFNGTKF
ncbi:MAG: hypothetical protein ACKOKF_10160, partial [Bacteroidota bacterium]